MQDLAVFSRPTGEELLRAVNMLRRNGLLLRGEDGRKHNPQLPLTIYFRNTSDEEVPPYGCMQVTGTEEVDGQNYLTIDKPVDTNGDAGAYILNLHHTVEADSFGVASAGPVARMISDDAAESGDHYAPIVDSWSVEQDDAGPFVAAGPDDIAEGTIKAFIFSDTSAANIVMFEITAADSGTGVVSEDKLCSEMPTGGMSGIVGEIVRYPCGVTSVEGEEDGEIDLVDPMQWLDDLEADEAIGKLGIAVLLQNPDASGSEPECEWVIASINIFYDRETVVDLRWVSGEGLYFDKERHRVQRWCKLPAELIPSTDCD